MKWKIYYLSEGAIYTTPGEPRYAPKTEVQCIVQMDEAHGWQLLAGAEFYVWDDRGNGPRWWGAEHLFDLYEYLFASPGEKVVLKGRFIEDEDFDKIHAEAMKDPDFKKKTGYRANERKPTQELGS